MDDFTNKEYLNALLLAFGNLKKLGERGKFIILSSAKDLLSVNIPFEEMHDKADKALGFIKEKPELFVSNLKEIMLMTQFLVRSYKKDLKNLVVEDKLKVLDIIAYLYAIFDEVLREAKVDRSELDDFLLDFLSKAELEIIFDFRAISLEEVERKFNLLSLISVLKKEYPKYLKLRFNSEEEKEDILETLTKTATEIKDKNPKVAAQYLALLKKYANYRDKRIRQIEEELKDIEEKEKKEIESLNESIKSEIEEFVKMEKISQEKILAVNKIIETYHTRLNVKLIHNLFLEIVNVTKKKNDFLKNYFKQIRKEDDLLKQVLKEITSVFLFQSVQEANLMGQILSLLDTLKLVLVNQVMRIYS